jgi:uncharacterized RDD family membrane protein YckC
MESTIRVSTGNYRYAGFWVRVLASLIDAVILALIGYVFFGNSVTNVSTVDGLVVNVSFLDWKALIPFIYTVGFWGLLSATPGKWLMKIKIVNHNGGKISWLKAVARYFSYIVSAITLGIGFLMVAFGAKKEALHDKIVKTYVVYRR